MKTKHILYSLLVTGLLGFSSCSEDFLETEPTYSLSVDAEIDTDEKAEALIIGTYDQLSYAYYGPHALGIADVKGEDVFVKSSGNYGRFVEAYTYTETANDFKTEEIWDYAYKTISNANVAINKLANASLEGKEKYIAEARALRAHSYFSLVQFFCDDYTVNPTAPGVPISTVIHDSETVPEGRGTVQQVYDLIIDDLEYAEIELGKVESDNIQRISQATVQGLLARVYLTMENWTKADEYARAALETGGFDPDATDYASAGLSSIEQLLGFNEPTDEWMWSLDMREDDNNGYLMLPSFYDTRTLGYSSFRVTVQYAALFEGGDKRNAYIGSSSEDGFTVEKFLHVSAWNMDQVMMRASEMYLIIAEANAELSNTTIAQNALNLIRTRAGASALAPTGETLINSILEERRRELMGEGFRYLDLKRRNLPLVKTGVSHWVEVNVAADGDRFNLPIPQDEIDANENITEADQNPGY